MSNGFLFDGDARGDQIVSGVTMRQLYVIMRDRVIYALDAPGSVDPDAVAQNFCCEVEKAMGIFPNVPGLTADE